MCKIITRVAQATRRFCVVNCSRYRAYAFAGGTSGALRSGESTLPQLGGGEMPNLGTIACEQTPFSGLAVLGGDAVQLSWSSSARKSMAATGAKSQTSVLWYV